MKRLKISTKGRYGLRAMVDIASLCDKGPVSISVIAERQNLSERYLEQIMALLKKGGLVRSIRGSSGGYVLAKEAKDISVGDVLRALEGSLEVVDCGALHPEKGCSSAEGCVTKYVWEKINDGITKACDEIRLSDLKKERLALVEKGKGDIQ